MTRLPLMVVLLAAAAAGGCTALDPFATQPREAQPGQPAGTRVGICYNTLKTSLPAVQVEAQRECPKETRAEPVDTDWYLQTCPVLLPARASFVCLPKK
jgi:hypothetical protein